MAVANEEMVRAIRVVSVEQGHDPRDLELVAFGGAGPLHACDVADELGIRTVLVPAAGGVLSALGHRRLRAAAGCGARRGAAAGRDCGRELRALVPSCRDSAAAFSRPPPTFATAARGSS